MPAGQVQLRAALPPVERFNPLRGRRQLHLQITSRLFTAKHVAKTTQGRKQTKTRWIEMFVKSFYLQNKN